MGHRLGGGSSARRRPGGIGVYGTTGRLEKCYRAYGTELESEYTVVEAGMAPPKVKDADFVGKEAHLRHRDEEPAAILCTLTVDDHTSSTGVARYPLGREPVLSRAGEPLVDAKGRRSYVTSAGAGPSVGKYLLMAYLPPEQAVDGHRAPRRLLRRPLPGLGRRRRRDPGLRPRERAHPLVNVLVCVKRVPLTGGKIVLTDDAQAIATQHLGFTISPHEECGVEEAVRLVEANGGESVVLTLGPPEAEEQLRDAMALGVDRAIHLVTDEEEWDAQATAAAIVGSDRGRAGGGRRVRPGLLRQRVGGRGRLPGRHPRRARARPPRRDRPQGSRRRRTDASAASRKSRADETSSTLPLPAVVTVKEGLNFPRYPSVPGRMRAQRKPVAASSPARPEPRLEKVRLVTPPGARKEAEILGHGPEAAPRVVEVLQRIGVA